MSETRGGAAIQTERASNAGFSPAGTVSGSPLTVRLIERNSTPILGCPTQPRQSPTRLALAEFAELDFHIGKTADSDFFPLLHCGDTSLPAHI